MDEGRTPLNPHCPLHYQRATYTWRDRPEVHGRGSFIARRRPLPPSHLIGEDSAWNSPRRVSPPTVGPDIRRRSPHPPLPTTQEDLYLPAPQETVPWFAPNELAVIQMKDANNGRCVAWVLRNITDPEALDVAMRLAGIIWWFEDGTDVKPLFDIIVFTFHTCFRSSRELYPGLRNRAYYSGRAILWIYTLAVCKFKEFTDTFSFPYTMYTAPESDGDLTQLLRIFAWASPSFRIDSLLDVGEGRTHAHSQ